MTLHKLAAAAGGLLQERIEEHDFRASLARG